MTKVLDNALLKLLPYSLRQDPLLVAIAEAAEIQLKEAYREAESLFNLVDIENIPEPLLDLLAYEKHVDIYDVTLPVDRKRAVIKASISQHRIKGTPAALEMIFRLINISSKLKEWFEYEGDPYHFKLEVSVRDKGLNEETLNLLKSLVFEYKNVRSWLEAIHVYLASYSKIHIGACSIYGEDITIYPWQITNIDIAGTYYLGSAQQTFDTTTVYPKEV